MKVRQRHYGQKLAAVMLAAAFALTSVPAVAAEDDNERTVEVGLSVYQSADLIWGEGAQEYHIYVGYEDTWVEAETAQPEEDVSEPEDNDEEIQEDAEDPEDGDYPDGTVPDDSSVNDDSGTTANDGVSTVETGHYDVTTYHDIVLEIPENFTAEYITFGDWYVVNEEGEVEKPDRLIVTAYSSAGATAASYSLSSKVDLISSFGYDVRTVTIAAPNGYEIASVGVSGDKENNKTSPLIVSGTADMTISDNDDGTMTFTAELQRLYGDETVTVENGKKEITCRKDYFNLGDLLVETSASSLEYDGDSATIRISGIEAWGARDTSDYPFSNGATVTIDISDGLIIDEISMPTIQGADIKAFDDKNRELTDGNVSESTSKITIQISNIKSARFYACEDCAGGGLNIIRYASGNEQRAKSQHSGTYSTVNLSGFAQESDLVLKVRSTSTAGGDATISVTFGEVSYDSTNGTKTAALTGTNPRYSETAIRLIEQTTTPDTGSDTGSGSGGTTESETGSTGNTGSTGSTGNTGTGSTGSTAGSTSGSGTGATTDDGGNTTDTDPDATEDQGTTGTTAGTATSGTSSSGRTGVNLTAKKGTATSGTALKLADRGTTYYSNGSSGTVSSTGGTNLSLATTYGSAISNIIAEDEAEEEEITILSALEEGDITDEEAEDLLEEDEVELLEDDSDAEDDAIEIESIDEAIDEIEDDDVKRPWDVAEEEQPADTSSVSVKKPFYKKPIFWFIIAAVAAAVIVALFFILKDYRDRMNEAKRMNNRSDDPEDDGFESDDELFGKEGNGDARDDILGE